MEKLIELLNEYEDNTNNHYRYYWGLDGSYISSNVSGTDHDLDKDEASIIIKSKEYGFIKWLVDNDKIDFDKCYFIKSLPNIKRKTYEDSKCDRLLMLLSIQDNPIEYLISVLR